jgi:N-acetylmuramoyl-L-alanine amidase
MTAVAKEAKTLQVYSIHCNAFNTTANGAEWLLSISTSKTHSDYKFCTQFLKDYCSMFGLTNRGIVQREGNNGDYYYLHRSTPSNCKVKYIELFFGDNRNDCKKGQTETYFDKATFFLASYILKRYGVTIEKPQDTSSNVLYLVQTGAFSSKENAENLVKSLKSKGFDAIIKTQTK